MGSNLQNIGMSEVDGQEIEYTVSIYNDFIDENKSLQQFYLDYQSANDDIDRLTNKATGLDYALAVSSGVLSGIIDALLVKELGLFKDASDAAKEKFKNDLDRTHKSINKYIENYARRKGFKGKGLKNAITFLEKKYPVAQDNAWSGKKISSTKSHHLDDLAHHPTILGLISAILVQYLRLSVFSDKQGDSSIIVIKIDAEEFLKNLLPIVISGVLKWLLNITENGNRIVDEEIPKPIQTLIENLYAAPAAISILKTVDNWYGHLVSDMGGSKNTPGGGTGIPGFFLSLMKEISMLPGVKNSNLPEILNMLYRGTKDSPLLYKLDLRAEITVINEQKLPVIINEIFVRTTYMISHLVCELRDNKEPVKIDWNKIVPFYNRTIVRMVTISTSSMEAIDVADATIRALVKSRGTPVFVPQFFMRINFVGVGRMVVACSTDAAMGLKKGDLEMAMLPGDTAMTSVELISTIKETEQISKNTKDNIQRTNEKINKLSNFKF